jgi:DNA-binding transcriptional regulator YiaG
MASALLPNGLANGRRVHRTSDRRLLRRLPWRAEDREPVLAALGAPCIPDVDVRALRAREGLSQADFARIYGLRLETVRSWEKGARPSQTARAYLALIAGAPHVVRRTLGLRW